jgi:mannose-1-phosphate guanylyltransferase
MRAFLLAAGEGRRLRPLTDTTPKCLVPINGKPLLALWLELCRRHGITEVLINLHHLPEKVLAFLKANDFGVNVTTDYQERLLGTSGTVLANWAFVSGESDFFIFYADNLTNVNLAAMLQFHRRRESLFTMGLFRTAQPKEKGIVTLDEQDRIVEFVEKPSQPRSDLANAGIYIAGRELYPYLPKTDFSDFGFDVLPKLVGKMHGYAIQEYLIDIGTPESYDQGQRDWLSVEYRDPKKSL